jgi:hypothetical protein
MLSSRVTSGIEAGKMQDHRFLPMMVKPEWMAREDRRSVKPEMRDEGGSILSCYGCDRERHSMKEQIWGNSDVAEESTPHLELLYRFRSLRP